MINCPNCRQALYEHERICPHCGTRLPEQPVHAPQNTPYSSWPQQGAARTPTPPPLYGAAQADGRPQPVPFAARPVADSTTSRLAVIIIAAAVVILGIIGVLGSGILRHSGTTTIGTSLSTSVGIVSPVTLGTPNPGGTSTTAGNSCASVLPGGGNASAGGGYADVPFPGGATTQAIIQESNGNGLYARSHVNACVPNLSTNDLNGFYAQAMANQGWSVPENAKVPYRFGGYMERCSGAQNNLCWTKDAAPRYVSLENVQSANGGATIFTLDLFTPPPPPNCSAAFSGRPYQPLFLTVDNSQALYIPMPPLTAMYQNSSGSGTTQYFLCSAGTVDSVSNFLVQTLPIQFWTQTSNSGNVQVWTARGYLMTITLSDPTNWEIDYSQTGP